MTAASTSRAERRRQAKFAAKSMSAPVLVQIRPITVAEMADGVLYQPGHMIFCIETLRCFGENGRDALGYQCQVWLPPEYRETSVANAKIAMTLLREINPNARAMIDKITEMSRDPRSRREALRIGMAEGCLLGEKGDDLWNRANTPPGARQAA